MVNERRDSSVIGRGNEIEKIHIIRSSLSNGCRFVRRRRLKKWERNKKWSAGRTFDFFLYKGGLMKDTFAD